MPASVVLSSAKLRGPLRPMWDVLVWSNALFCACALVYGRAGHWLHGGLLFASGVASALFHLHREPHPSRLCDVDTGLAYAALLSTCRFFPLLPPATRALGAALVASACACKFAVQPLRYRLGHTLWHLLVAAGQLLVAVAVSYQESAQGRGNWIRG